MCPHGSRSATTRGRTSAGTALSIAEPPFAAGRGDGWERPHGPQRHLEETDRTLGENVDVGDWAARSLLEGNRAAVRLLEARRHGSP